MPERAERRHHTAPTGSEFAPNDPRAQFAQSLEADVTNAGRLPKKRTAQQEKILRATKVYTGIPVTSLGEAAEAFATVLRDPQEQRLANQRLSDLPGSDHADILGYTHLLVSRAEALNLDKTKSPDTKPPTPSQIPDTQLRSTPPEQREEPVSPIPTPREPVDEIPITAIKPTERTPSHAKPDTHDEPEQDQVVEAEILSDESGEFTTTEVFATLFQMLDLVTEDHEHPWEKEDLLNAAMAAYTFHTDKPVDDATRKQLFSTDTKGNVSQQRFEQGLALVSEFIESNDDDLIDHPFLPRITTDRDIHYIKESGISLQRFIKQQFSEARNNDELPEVSVPIPTPQRETSQTGKEIELKEEGVELVPTMVEMEITGPQGAEGRAYRFGAIPGNTTTVSYWSTPEGKIYQIKNNVLPNDFPLARGTRLDWDNDEHYAVFSRIDHEGQKVVFGYIDTIKGTLRFGNGLQNPNEFPPRDELTQEQDRSEIVRPDATQIELAKLKAEVAALRERSTRPQPAREPQAITARRIPDRQVEVYRPRNADGTPRELNVLERAGLAWQEFRETPAYLQWRKFAGAPVSPDVVVPPTLASDIRANIQRLRDDAQWKKDVKDGVTKGPDKGWASLEDVDYLRVDPHPERLADNRLHLAEGFAAEKNIGLFIIGKTGSGKDHFLTKHTLVRHRGPANARSVKTDLLDETLAAREQIGPTHILAPFGFGDRNSAMEQRYAKWMSTFSLIPYMDTYDNARHVGQLAMDTGTTTRSGEARDFWNQFARILITTDGFYQNKAGGTMADIVKDLQQLNTGLFNADNNNSQTQQLQGRKEIEALFKKLHATAIETGDPAVIRDFEMTAGDWEGFAGMHHKQAASVVSTARAFFDVYNNTRVQETTSSSKIDLSEIVANNGTVYTYASAIQLREIAPFLRVFDDLITEEAVRQYENQGKAIPHSLLNVRGEAGVGELSEYVPTNITTGRGQGVVEVLQFQNLVQARAALGEAGLAAALNNMQLMILPGAGPEAEAYLQQWLGTTRVTETFTETTKNVTKVRPTRSRQVINTAKKLQSDEAIKGQKVVTENTTTTTKDVEKPIMEPGDFALDVGEAITLTKGKKPFKLKLQPFHEDAYANALIRKSLHEEAMAAAREGSRTYPRLVRDLVEGQAQAIDTADGGPEQAQLDTPDARQAALEGQEALPAIEQGIDGLNTQHFNQTQQLQDDRNDFDR